jgi:hypothetical protein
MVKMNQKEAVFNAVTNTCEPTGDNHYEPTKDERAVINQILFEGFRNETIELDREYSDSELKSYVSGLQSNWLRKDKRLNGGVQYVAKNPGSRAGSGDPQIKALRLLLSTKSDPVARAEIQKAIDARAAQVKPTKAELTAEQIELLKAAGLEHLVG